MSLRTVDNFPFLEDKIYFNCAAQGALPESTIKTIERYIEDYCDALRGKNSSDEPDYGEVRDKGKKLFARIIGASASEIAFVRARSTTTISTV